MSALPPENLPSPITALPASASTSAVSSAFELPSRKQALWFWFRIRMLTLQRIAQDALSPSIRRWPAAHAPDDVLSNAPILAEVRSPLWSDGRADEFALAAGKVHNLRLALQAFDGVELPAGAVLSFWQQLGRIAARKGFVLGREIREGCVVPTIGGGICQLSNALATAASRAGLVLMERHGHTAMIESASRDAANIDATVLWKHIDLRLATTQPVRLEVTMDHSHLTLRLRGWPAAQPQQQAAVHTAPIKFHQKQRPSTHLPVVRSCVTCDETQCFRHQPELADLAGQQGSSMALLDGLTPELALYLQQTPRVRERLLLPHTLTQGQRQQVTRHLVEKDWHLAPQTLHSKALALRRALWLRWNAQSAGQRQASVLDGQRWQATQMLQQIQTTDTQLLVDQAYLPTLWQSGQLAGRQLSVWMPALPIQTILQQLDHAASLWPDEASLRDFRPDPALVQAELQALQSAQHIITPHHAVARWARLHLKSQVTELPWASKQPVALDSQAPAAIKTIVFPASTLARKGWRELCAALAQLPHLPLQLIVLGTVFNRQHLPAHVQLRSMRFDQDWLAQAHAVVLPAHVEHNPRALRLALAAGLPVIATPACGLAEQAGLQQVAEGDVAALAQALMAL